MLAHTKLAIHVFACAVFTCCFAISILLLYFATVGMAGDPSNAVTVFTKELLARQQSVFAIFGTLLTGLPALCLALSTNKRGRLTSYGLVYLAILIPTFVIATIGNVYLEPKGVELGGIDTPGLADTTMLRLAGYSLTFIVAILGIKALGAQQ